MYYQHWLPLATNQVFENDVESYNGGRTKNGVGYSVFTYDFGLMTQN